MAISDSVFKQNLDKAFREQGFLKKEREELIHNYLIDSFIDRDCILDMEERKAREVVAKKKQDKLVPSEFKEQCDFVAWFKQAYPDIRIMAIRNHGTRSQKEKTDQLLEGLLPGAADLYIPFFHLWIEFKRIKGGILSDKQIEFRDYVINECGDSWFMAEGFEDGKEKLDQFICYLVDV